MMTQRRVGCWPIVAPVAPAMSFGGPRRVADSAEASAMVLFGLLLFPIAHELGIHEVHYAMVAILTMVFGLFARPFRVGYYVACTTGGCNADDTFRHIWH